ncbi:MAG: hypothetical protein ACK40G_06995 [Cytophagaceae bacterium]
MTKISNGLFYKGILTILICTSGLTLALRTTYPQHILEPQIWITQGFILTILLVSHWIAGKGLKDKAIDFHIYYMGSMGLRFLLSVFYLFLIVYLHPENVWAFVINFFILYFIYTSFEIYSLLANLRAEIKKE